MRNEVKSASGGGKKIVWIVIGIIVVVVGYRIVRIVQSRAEITKEVRKIARAVSTARAKVGKISSSLSFVGDVKGEDEVSVHPEVTGKLIKYVVEVGKEVEKDQTIALVDRGITAMKYEPAPVKSPISGIVTKLDLDKGSRVAPQIPVAEVVKMDRVKVKFNVGEKNLDKIWKGQRAEVKVDAYPKRVFRGEVSRVSPVCDPATRSIPVEVVLENPGHKLKPGMFAEVTLITAVHSNALLLPREAVVEDLEENSKYVFIVKEGNAIKKEVKTGLVSGKEIEITQGINKNDEVIIKGQHWLKDGEAIQIVSGER